MGAVRHRARRATLAFAGVLLLASEGSALAQIVSSEFFSDPVSEGWTLVQQYCNPKVWVQDGWYHQSLDFDGCGGPPGGGQDSYTRQIGEFEGLDRWFMEFSVLTTAPSSELPGQAPAPVTTANSFGIVYGATVSSDLIKLFRDTDLPILFIPVEQGVPHTVRLELVNEAVSTFSWFIDGSLVSAGLAEGPFPVQGPRIAWRGRAWYLPTENAWSYIRYGRTPEPHSGDMDSSGHLDLVDFYFFQECLTAEHHGPGQPVWPGCRWADMDADGSLDMHDFGAFQRAFTGGDNE